MKNSSMFLRVVVVFLAVSLSTIPALAGVTFTPASGVTFTGASGVTFTGASGVTFTGASGVTLAGASGVTFTGASGVTFTGASGVTFTGASQLPFYNPPVSGIAGFDPELALLLDSLPNTSLLNVVLTYHQYPTAADFSALRGLGILGGTYFRKLPMIVVTATKGQIQAISRFPTIRSIYANKTFHWLTQESTEFVGADRVAQDAQLTALNNGLPVTGKGVTIAVLDTGVDATHPDLAGSGKMVGNVKVIDTGGLGLLFVKPTVLEGLTLNDELGHGTFVAATAAGTGSASNQNYAGVASGASILGVSIGNISMLFVLAGFDYVLANKDRYNIKVVNCSFAAETLYDANDPVNISTRLLYDQGLTVVVAAGNRGPGADTLNPYAVAPWVIGVASGDKKGRLSNFSSRGGPLYQQLHPTLTAPGQGIVSARSTLNQLSQLLPTEDESSIPTQYRLQYTKASGTSFSAPHVAGTIALMLEANPNLTPAAIKTLLQLTASPMLGYRRYEVGAGYLNAYAAVCAARVANLPYGAFRATFETAPITYSHDPVSQYQATAPAQGILSIPLTIPTGTLIANLELGWRDTRLVSNDLALAIRAPNGQLVAQSNQLNGLGLFAQREALTLRDPVAGNWTIEISNTLGNITPLLATSQPCVIALEMARVDVSLNDIASLPALTQDAVVRTTERLLLPAPAGNFQPFANVSRAEFTRALMLAAGARVPQYAPFSATFTDVSANNEQYLFVESCVHSPQGNLIYQATGTSFQPQANIDRLTAAVAYVKALGLTVQAVQAANTNPGLSDWDSLPMDARGFVSVAVQLGILNSIQGAFQASQPITRAELAEQLIQFQSRCLAE
ncbi:MAG: S8 family serine peptidase [Acidobacteriota bacterium]